MSNVNTKQQRTTADAVAAGLIYRAGLEIPKVLNTDAERQRHERQMEAGQDFTAHSMIDICREALIIEGRDVPHNRADLVYRATSTAALTNIFSAVVNAGLVHSYTEAGDTTTGWTQERDIQDFKSNERTRLGKASNLEKLARGDSASDASISDNSESYKIARYAKKFTIDEQDLLDDNFNALLSMPQEMGAAAGRLRPDLVYSILLANAALADGVALFHADHGNYETGNALTAITLQAAMILMAKQTEDSVQLNLRAETLIVPPDLDFGADVILTSASRTHADADDGVKNPILGRGMKLAVDNRIGAAGVTDPTDGTSRTGTATNFFLAANPAIAPTIEIGFLAGTGRKPSVRSYPLSQGQYGIGFDVKFDIGAKALDHRGLYYGTGV